YHDCVCHQIGCYQSGFLSEYGFSASHQLYKGKPQHDPVVNRVNFSQSVDGMGCFSLSLALFLSFFLSFSLSFFLSFSLSLSFSFSLSLPLLLSLLLSSS